MEMRFIGGTDSHPAPAVILTQALHLCDYARSLGLAVILSHSQTRGSPSRYLTLRDTSGHSWLLRVSNHLRPRFRGHETPHFDLTSRDGIAGLIVAKRWIDMIGRGELPWEPAQRERRADRHRRRS